ncbi:MAG: M23 family metallopeptidase [Kofleriaceae bacterium]|nr:M23 family metallopeptidase [Kofleriaceae bacterium]
MDDIALALNPPRFVKQRRRKPIRLVRSPSRVWPLAAINGRVPVVLDPTHPCQRGVELAYPRATPDDAMASCPVGTPNGTATHLMPAMTAALAIDDGVIMFAGRLGHGFGVILDHGNGWASHYANLQAVAAIRTDLYRPREQHVRAGDVIGYVGAPAPDALKRLHFELWERDRSRCFVPVDPRPHLVGWKLLEHRDAFTPAPPAARGEAA